MENRLFNLIVVLITGRVWSGSGLVAIDFWDYEPGVKWFIDHTFYYYKKELENMMDETI